MEVVYGITSRSAERANAAALLVLLRDHGKIENGLHYVRNVTVGEDACRMRTGTAPQVLAALRNAVVYLLADVEAKSRPEAIERLQLHPEEARKLIGIPQRVNKGMALALPRHAKWLPLPRRAHPAYSRRGHRHGGGSWRTARANGFGGSVWGPRWCWRRVPSTPACSGRA